MSDLFRRLCEHEAAHAVVSAHLGYAVHEVVVKGRQGWTLREDDGAPQAASITAAGDVWDRELSGRPYVDLSCADLPDLVRSVGIDGVWAAQRTAREVLTRYRRSVLVLADRVVAADGRLRFRS